MRSRRTASIVTIALVLGAIVPLSGAQADPVDKIQRGLLHRLQTGDLDGFVVEFRAEADLSRAAQVPGWAARGRAVYRSLATTAVRTQAGARDVIAATPGAHATTYWVSNVMLVEGRGGLARRLAALPEVSAIRAEEVAPLVEPIERHGVREPGDAPPWGITKIGADQVWADGILGSGIVVANIDTGVDYTHEALVDHYRGNLGGGTFDHNYAWWDPTGLCGDEPCDNEGHGTHTMGTMVGGDGPGPFTPDIGVAPGATWIAAKGCEEFYCTEGSLLSAAEFILAPTDLDGLNPDPSKRPDIVNNSWGGPPGDDWYLGMVQAWRAAGIAPIFASGNPGSECGAGGSPGDYLDSFSAGATDENDEIAYFSGRGPSAFGKVNPDVAAPGVDVISSIPGDNYGSGTGTSMAAPHTAGTLALILSAEPALLGDVTGSTGALRSTALDLLDDSCGGEDDGDPNNVYGDGRIDALTAVTLVATGGTLAGDITDVTTTDPIAGARIEASGFGRTFAATTDAAGHFELFLGAGTYTVVASAFGYQAGLATGVEIETDLTTTQDFYLAALPRRDVVGTVTAQEDGSPIEGAEVRALGTPVAPAVTAADGTYTLTLPIGDFTLRTSAGGCTSADLAEVTLGLGGLTHDVAITRTLDDFGHGCSAIGLDWVDASADTALFGDQTVGRLPLPFPFPFYGEDQDAVYLTDNGYLTFEAPIDGWPEPTPGSIPSTSTPNAAIYALWQNLRIDDASAVRYETIGVTPDRAFVIEFEQLRVGPRLGDGGTQAETAEARVDFEVKLWEDGTIDILYGDNPANPGDGRDAGIGIENAEGTDALRFSLFDDVVGSNTAFRYEVVPSGHLAGTITDSNDGLPVPGATVTALPGGRTVTTGADGTYELRLRPGTYDVTVAADRYVSHEEAGIIITDGVVTPLDAALDAPIAAVDPAAFDASVAFGRRARPTLTISNPGTSDLTWQILERDGSRTVPDLPPLPRIVRDATWGPADLPANIESVRPTALPPAALETVIDDPDDDSLGAIEVTAIRGGSDNAETSIAVDFGAGTDVAQAAGYIYLDTDQDPETGYPPEYFSGLPGQDIGFDYFADLFSIGETEPVVHIWDLNFELVAEVPATIDGQTLSFGVPLEAFGPDEDGEIDIAATIGDWYQPLDWAPDEGHGTIRAFTDAEWMAADPASGIVPAGDSVQVAVTLGSQDLPPGDYEGFLFLLADAPKQPATPIEVTLTVRRPERWGIAEGRVRDAHTGEAIEDARVAVDARWNGEALPIVTTTDDRGRWSVQGPQGAWPARARHPGFVPDEGKVVIVAGRTTGEQGFRLHVDQPHATLEARPVRLTMLRGDRAHETFVLGNVGGHQPLTFRVGEVEVPVSGGGGGDGGGPEPLTLPDGADPNARTSESAGHTSPGASGLDRIGDVLEEWRTGMSAPWGVSYRPAGVVTLSDAEEVIDVEFTAKGKRLAEFDLPWAGAWGGDLAWDQGRGLLWQVNVGGDNGIYGLDPADGSVVEVVTGAGWGDISQRGLAYDADTDTFYIGGWNEGIVYHVAGPSWPEPGATLDSCAPEDPNISGLAFNPAFQMLWVATNSRHDDIWLVDPNTCETQGYVPHPGKSYSGAGLELDAVGNLWTVSQRSRKAYLIESGLPTFSDVPWLDVGPKKGTVRHGHRTELAVDVDATGLEPGVYRALVAVITDDPDAGAMTVPITLTVTRYQRFVNVGGDAIALHDGARYVADRRFFGGSFGWVGASTRALTTAHEIAGTTRDAVYRTARQGMSAYRFTAPEGRYLVRLEFAEITSIAEFGRIMDIYAEGRQVANNLDLAGQAGRWRAHDLEFEVRSRGGVLSISFDRAFGAPPLVNGIRVTWLPPGA